MIAALIGIFGAIIGVYAWVGKHQLWVSKHTSDNDIHPSKKDIVFKDVCEVERKGINDCIEGEVRLFNEKIKSINEKIDTHHSFNKSQFTEIKNLIRNKNKKND